MFNPEVSKVDFGDGASEWFGWVGMEMKQHGRRFFVFFPSSGGNKFGGVRIQQHLPSPPVLGGVCLIAARRWARLERRGGGGEGRGDLRLARVADK